MEQNNQLEKISNRLDSMDKTLVRQTLSLEEHMRRTEVLEDTLIPLKSFIDRCKGALTLVAGVGALKAAQVVLAKLGLM